MRKLMMLLLPFLLISCSGTKEKPALNKQQIAPVVYALMIADEVTLQKSYKDSTKTLKQCARSSMKRYLRYTIPIAPSFGTASGIMKRGLAN